MNIIKTLQKPHPYVFSKNSVIIPTLITFLVIIIFKPFDFDKIPTSQLLLWSSVFAFVVACTIMVGNWLAKIFFKHGFEDRWTVLKEILLILSVVTLIAMILYTLFLFIDPQLDRLYLFQLVVIRTLIISFFPVLVLVFYEQVSHQKIKIKQAEMFNEELIKRNQYLNENQEKKQIEESSNQKLVLMAENLKPILRIDPKDIYYVRSEGNYVEVFYGQASDIQKELIRNSLKSIEDQLPSKSFFRCHNRFLINLDHIQKVDGNARNLDISLANIEINIPVSRSKSDSFLELFNQRT